MRLPILWRLGALAVLLGAFPAQAQTLRADAPVRLVADGQASMHPVWSPDGAWIAFTRAGYTGLWLADADGRTIRQLTDAPAAGFGFSWSPDGTALVTRTARLDGRRRLDAVTVFALDGTATALTDERAAMTDVPRWIGPRHVALRTDDGLDVYALDVGARAVPTESFVIAQPDGGLALAQPATGALREVGPFQETRVLNVTPSPDGARVAFEVYGGNLFVMDRDGTNVIDLGAGSRPTWSPDGRWIAVMTTQDDGHTFTAADLVAVRSDGSARVVLTQTPDRLEMNPSWSPDGRRIAFDDAADGALYVLPVSE